MPELMPYEWSTGCPAVAATVAAAETNFLLATQETLHHMDVQPLLPEHPRVS
jgi:hypothetical protein